MDVHPEQAAFEKAIDEAPHEATNHLVYADWLDEHGQPEEAAFRRAMGEWMQTHHKAGTNPEWVTPHGKSWHAGVFNDPKGHNTYLGVPDHVDSYLFRPLSAEDYDRDWAVDPPERHRPRFVTQLRDSAIPAGWQWDTYRDMEDAFRRAYRPKPTTHSRISPKQFAGYYASAVRKS